jgi:hypothetical protein
MAKWGAKFVRGEFVLGYWFNTHCPEAIRLSAFVFHFLCLSVGHILNRYVIVAIDFGMSHNGFGYLFLLGLSSSHGWPLRYSQSRL